MNENTDIHQHEWLPFQIEPNNGSESTEIKEHLRCECGRFREKTFVFSKQREFENIEALDENIRDAYIEGGVSDEEMQNILKEHFRGE